MKKKIAYSTLWAGNDESWSAYIAALGSAKACTDCQEPAEEAQANRLLTMVEDVAIISIHGTLVNEDSWYNSLFGLVAYSEIVDALYRAALDDNVREIIVDAASGGGAVNGVLDAVNAMKRTAEIKRITAFTSSTMCSAMYWLVAPAHERYGSAVSTVGSIGVVIKHVEHSKAAEIEGIKETVIRAGKFKQLANSAEPLSDLARTDLEEKAQYIYSVFVDSVASNLGVSYQLCDTRMADGKEFIGQQAVDAGLLDGVANFEDVFGKAQARANSSGGADMQKKRYIGAAAMAAATAGVDLEGGQIPEAPGEAPALGAGTEEAQTEANTPDTLAPPPPQTAPAAANGDANTSAVALLSAQLKEKDAALLLAKVELAAANKFKDEVSGLKLALAEVVNNMAVALGGTKDDKLATAETAALLSLHQTMTARTIDAFKVGGIAGSREEIDDEKPMLSRYEKAVASAKVPQR